MQKNDIGGITVFFDIDGVLGDFDRHLDAHGCRKPDGGTDWDKLTLGWWTSMPAMRDAQAFFTAVAALTEARFLTAPVMSADCFYGKALWVEKFLPEEGKYALKRLIIAHAADKCHLARANHVLIDDRQKNIDEWVAAGGIGILFKGDFADVARQLQPHLPALSFQSGQPVTPRPPFKSKFPKM